MMPGLLALREGGAGALGSTTWNRAKGSIDGLDDLGAASTPTILLALRRNIRSQFIHV